MAGRWQHVFIQDFTSVDTITVTHNLGLEYLNVRLIVDGNPRPDLIEKVIVTEGDPTNELTVDLVSSQSGTVQILEADTYMVGASPNTRQYQAFTHGQHFTSAESLGATENPNNTFLQKVRLTTPSVEAGDYLINWSFTWNMSQISFSFVAQVEQDDTTQLWQMWERAANGGTEQESPAAGFAHVTLTEGVHTFDLDFRHDDSGSTTARMTNARLSFWRVT